MLRSPLQFEADQIFDRLNVAITRGDRAAALDLTDKLELFIKPLTEQEDPQMWAEYGLTRREQRIVSTLFARKGLTTSRSGVMQALYFDHINDWPNEKIIDVFVMRARLKLLVKDAWHIETVWGQGFRLMEGPAPAMREAA